MISRVTKNTVQDVILKHIKNTVQYGVLEIQTFTARCA